MTWTNSFELTLHNTSTLLYPNVTGGGVHIELGIPIQSAPDDFEEGDSGLITYGAKSGHIIFGSLVAPGIRRAHLHGISMPADSVEVWTATPEAVSTYPPWNLGYGVSLFGGAVYDPTHLAQPTLFFGSNQTAPWTPTHFEELFDEAGWQVYRAYGEHTLDGGQRLHIDWKWYFRPETGWVDWDLEVVYSDMQHLGHSAALPALFLGTPATTDGAWWLSVQNFLPRGGLYYESAGYSGGTRFRVVAALHLPVTTGLGQSMSWRGAMAYYPSSDLVECLLALREGRIWASAEQDLWEGKVPLFGKVPELHGDPVIDWDVEALEQVRRFRTQRDLLASYEPPDLFFALGPTATQHRANTTSSPPIAPRRVVWVMYSSSGPTGPSEAFHLNPFAELLGPPRTNPGFLEELQWWLQADLTRPGTFFWPITGTAPWTLADDYVTASGLTPGAEFKAEDLPLDGSEDTVFTGPGEAHGSSDFTFGKGEGFQPGAMADGTRWPPTSHNAVHLMFAYYAMTGDLLAKAFLRRWINFYLHSHGVWRSDFYLAYAIRPLENRSMRIDLQAALYYFLETDASLKDILATRFGDRADSPDSGLPNSFGTAALSYGNPGYNDFEAHYNPGTGVRGINWWVDYCEVNRDGWTSSVDFPAGTAQVNPWQSIYVIPGVWAMWKAYIAEFGAGTPSTFTELPRILQIGWDLAHAWVKHFWFLYDHVAFPNGHPMYAGWTGEGRGKQDTSTDVWFMPRYTAAVYDLPPADPDYVALAPGSTASLAPPIDWMTDPGVWTYGDPPEYNLNHALFAAHPSEDARMSWNGDAYRVTSYSGWPDPQYVTMPQGALRCFLDMAETVIPVLGGACLVDALTVRTKARTILRYREARYFEVYSPRHALNRTDYLNETYLAGGAWSTTYEEGATDQKLVDQVVQLITTPEECGLGIITAPAWAEMPEPSIYTTYGGIDHFDTEMTTQFLVVNDVAVTWLVGSQTLAKAPQAWADGQVSTNNSVIFTLAAGDGVEAKAGEALLVHMPEIATLEAEAGTFEVYQNSLAEGSLEVERGIIYASLDGIRVGGDYEGTEIHLFSGYFPGSSGPRHRQNFVMARGDSVCLIYHFRWPGVVLDGLETVSWRAQRQFSNAEPLIDIVHLPNIPSPRVTILTSPESDQRIVISLEAADTEDVSFRPGERKQLYGYDLEIRTISGDVCTTLGTMYLLRELIQRG